MVKRRTVTEWSTDEGVVLCTTTDDEVRIPREEFNRDDGYQLHLALAEFYGRTDAAPGKLRDAVAAAATDDKAAMVFVEALNDSPFADDVQWFVSAEGKLQYYPVAADAQLQPDPGMDQIKAAAKKFAGKTE